MKNVKNILAVIALVAMAMGANAQTYKINSSSSNIAWVGSKVTGKHNGDIKIKDGSTLTFRKGQLVGGTINVDMTTINVLDLQGESKGKLEGHLKSDDFFGVSKYPTATIVITKVVPQGPGKYKVTGDLKIKDNTREVKFLADVKNSGSTVNADASLVVDRAEYDIRYGSGSFFDGLADKTIYDDFDLQISLVAEK